MEGNSKNETTASSCNASLLFFHEASRHSYNDDDDEELQPISWRSDPRMNYSDWTIEIVVVDDNDWIQNSKDIMTQTATKTQATYHVHKSILGIGPRRCKFFSTLFQTLINVPERKVSTSRIELTDRQANVFPKLLDFCYNLGPVVIDSAATAVELRSITSYFGCDALQIVVDQFIHKDWSSSIAEKSPLYLMLAAAHNDVVLEESARRTCAEHIEEMDDEDVLQLPVDLFRSLILSPHLKCHSEALAWIVAEFLRRHLDAISTRLLIELTDEVILPRIDADEALVFFELIRDLHPSAEEWMELESLSHRCGMGFDSDLEWTGRKVETASYDLWKELASSTDLATIVIPKALPPPSLATAATTTITSATTAITTTITTTNDNVSAVVKCGPADGCVVDSQESTTDMLLNDYAILISRLTADLLEAQRFYNTEWLSTRRRLQSENQRLLAQTKFQNKLLKRRQHILVPY